MTLDKWLAREWACSDARRRFKDFHPHQVWETCADPDALLWALERLGYNDIQVLRLWTCWCIRQIWEQLTDERSRAAVEIAERYAVGEATEEELKAARDAAWDAARYAARNGAWDTACNGAWAAACNGAWAGARNGARAAARNGTWDTARAAAISARDTARAATISAREAAREAARAAQCGRLREVIPWPAVRQLLTAAGVDCPAEEEEP